MSVPARPWCARMRDEATVEVVARVPQSARELVLGLLGSRAAAGRVLAAGRLRMGGRALAAHDRLEPGAVATLSLHVPPAGPAPSDGVPPVTIVYRDPLLLVADKPAGLLVHGDGTGADTLLARLRRQIGRPEGDPTVQAVQRLDMETTGLVLVSLTEEFQPVLDAQVAGRAMRKRYVAVTRAVPAGCAEGWLVIDDPLGRDRHDARRMRAGATGKPATTRVRLLSRRSGHALLLVELGSGRRHQIRVHLAHRGCPLVGDALYGGARHADGLMLHAWEERLLHPLTREPLVLRSAWPARFARLGFCEPAV